MIQNELISCNNLWFPLDEWIHDTEIKCQEYDIQFFLLKKDSWTKYYLQFITLETQGVDFSLKY